MAKDKSEKKDKRERKDKEKRSEKDGVSKTKKEKKSKKVAQNGEVTAALLETLDKHSPPVEAVKTGDGLPIRAAPPVGAIVPFANPLADEKACKKLLKTVKKGTLLLQLCPGSLTRSQDVLCLARSGRHL
jgi:H/ACA ribonucleoprotein complex subunit 2